MPILMLAV